MVCCSFLPSVARLQREALVSERRARERGASGDRGMQAAAAVAEPALTACEGGSPDPTANPLSLHNATPAPLAPSPPSAAGVSLSPPIHLVLLARETLIQSAADQIVGHC